VVGDQVLSGIAQAIQGQIREIDLAGRYGGEEFLVIFPSTGLAAARVAAERIREKIGQLLFSPGFSVSVSGGLACYAGESAQELVVKADRCLYRAKESGRNQIVSCPD
jgi:diguanylate cyclase (GGDEF)-like protein